MSFELSPMLSVLSLFDSSALLDSLAKSIEQPGKKELKLQCGDLQKEASFFEGMKAAGQHVEQSKESYLPYEKEKKWENVLGLLKAHLDEKKAHCPIASVEQSYTQYDQNAPSVKASDQQLSPKEQALFLLGEHLGLELLAKLIQTKDIQAITLGDDPNPILEEIMLLPFSVSQTAEQVRLFLPSDKNNTNQLFLVEKSGQVQHLFFTEQLSTQFGERNIYAVTLLTYQLDEQARNYRFISQKEATLQFSSVVEQSEKEKFNPLLNLNEEQINHFKRDLSALFQVNDILALLFLPSFFFSDNTKTFNQLFMGHLNSLGLCLVSSKKTDLQIAIEQENANSGARKEGKTLRAKFRRKTGYEADAPEDQNVILSEEKDNLTLKLIPNNNNNNDDFTYFPFIVV